MSYSTEKERDEFIQIATSEGLSESTARRLMRYAATLQKLAEAECNGDDWRDERGPRHLVIKGNPAGQFTKCGEALVTKENVTAKMRTTFSRSLVTCSSCKSALVKDRAHAALPRGFKAITQGDPRGAVLKITVPSGRTNDWGQEGICVP